MLSEHDRRYLISDQDWDVRRPLDLLQTWGPPAREPLRVRLGRILGAMRQCHLPSTMCAVGAVFDALVIIPMLFPRIAVLVFGIRDFNPGSDYRYAICAAASLMLGWSGLLLWTFLNPIERRGVLLLTGIPGIAGLMAAGIYAVAENLIRLTAMVPMFVPNWCYCVSSSSATISPKLPPNRQPRNRHALVICHASTPLGDVPSDVPPSVDAADPRRFNRNGCGSGSAGLGEGPNGHRGYRHRSAGQGRVGHPESPWPYQTRV